MFHVGYFKHVLTILQCVCKECSRALVHPQERTTLLRRMRDPRADALRKQALYKRVVGRGAAFRGRVNVGVARARVPGNGVERAPSDDRPSTHGP